MGNHRIIKTYKEDFPVCRFVGKMYRNCDRVDGAFGYQWGQWHENEWFKPLEERLTEDFKAKYPETEMFIGLMRDKFGGSDDFEYWIGMFLPADCDVPEGYDSIEVNHRAAGICWIKGQEWDLYCHEGECYAELEKSGFAVARESDGRCMLFERYNCPRFTAPDENGEVILDLGFFAE